MDAGWPLGEVQEQINAVVQRIISESRGGRGGTLRALTDQLCNDFVGLIPGSAGENGCIELLWKLYYGTF